MSQNQADTGRKAGEGRCPVCGKVSVFDFRPFCSRRCRDVDLNRWLAGVYRIETEEAPDEMEVPPAKSGD